MRRGCRLFASALAMSLILGMSTPSVAMAYSYRGKSYQYANNLDKANKKVESSKNKLYGTAKNNEGSSSSSEASTSYVGLLLENGKEIDELDIMDAMKDISFGGKSVLTEDADIRIVLDDEKTAGWDDDDIEESEIDPDKIEPVSVKVGRLKVKLEKNYKLKKLEIGTFQPNKKGEMEFVYKTVVSGSQVTLGDLAPDDWDLPYAPTEIRITFYSLKNKKTSIYTITLYSQLKR